ALIVCRQALLDCFAFFVVEFLTSPGLVPSSFISGFIHSSPPVPSFSFILFFLLCVYVFVSVCVSLWTCGHVFVCLNTDTTRLFFHRPGPFYGCSVLSGTLVVWRA